MTNALRLDAPAKLNLSLAVVGRRADGRHELASVFVLLELADRLLLMDGCSGLRVEAADDRVPVDASNLAWRGLLAGLGAQPDFACLTLDKRIPAAAGLGGGSSDAAAAWRLGRRWIGADEQAGDEELRELGEIGADVPFFAAQRPAAYVTGIGEQIRPLAAADALEVVLAVPSFGLSTAAVFAELRRADWSRAAPPRTTDPGRNDLLAAARRLRQEIDGVFRVVEMAGGEPHLTGSGPTVYALTDDPQRAEAIAAAAEVAGLRAVRTRLARTATTIVAMSEEETGSP